MLGIQKQSRECSLLLKPFRQARYRRLGSVGEGGIAEITSYFDGHLKRVVAAKSLKPSNAKNPHHLRFFINEARLISYLDHPGIISVYDTFVQDDGGLCFTMKLLQGRKLGDLIAEHAQPTSSWVHEALDIFVKVCQALAHVHEKGVIHLDLKPDNIMVGASGEVMVMDWGNACVFDHNQYDDYLRSASNDIDPGALLQEDARVVVGTPLYMSPEQTNQQRDRLRAPSDIFSLGIVLYEMLSGSNPFMADTIPHVLDRVRTLDPRPLHEENANVPRRLSEICAKMIRKDPRDRYASFRAVLADIADMRNSGQAFTTRQYGPGEVIFKEGDPGDYSCIVLSGTVEISKRADGRKAVLATLGVNEILGELAIFTKLPRSATAVAVEPTVVRVMSREDIDVELAKLSPWVGQMISGLCHRFLAQNDRLIEAAEALSGRK